MANLISQPDCIFCKITKCEIPSSKVAEDDHHMAVEEAELRKFDGLKDVLVD